MIIIFYVLSIYFGIVQSILQYTISENSSTDHLVGNVLKDGTLTAKYQSDADNLQYSLMSQGSMPTDYFSIDPSTGEIRLARAIDRDNLCDLLMICCAFDSDGSGQCIIKLSVIVQPTKGDFFIETIRVEVTVLDENDNSPTFPSKEINGHISEASGIGATVILPMNGDPLIATDIDAAHNSVKKYYIISPTGTFGLRVKEDVGIATDVAVVTLKNLDREKVSTYKVVVVAEDGGKPPKSGSIILHINIDDFNDHAPVFENETYHVSMSETTPLDTSVLTVKASDNDTGMNANINYIIRNRPNDIVSRIFTINSITGEIRTKGRLNYEDHSSYRIVVEARDEGVLVQKKAQAIVVVNVEDVNDHGPIIKPSYLSKQDRAEVSEEADVGKFVALFVVTDPDNDEVDCTIDNADFSLQRSKTSVDEFHLVTAQRLDREMIEIQHINLLCYDTGIPQQRTNENVIVHVLDANDNSPQFMRSTYNADIQENNDINVFVINIKATDADEGENARIIYSLDDIGDADFAIDSNNGRITARRVFNREEENQIRFKVYARDNGSEPRYTEANVFVRITDRNDNAPTFLSPAKFEISEAAGPGVMLGQLSATDPDQGRNSEIQFLMKPTHDAQSFLITRNGLITTLVQLDREKQDRYELVVIAKDNGIDVEHSCSSTVTILVTDINDNAPIIHFPNPHNNTVYISYLEPVGQVVLYINASDADLAKNAVLDYTLTHGNEAKYFKINRSNGAIMVAKTIQKQDAIVYKLGVRVMDRSEPYNSNIEILNIVVDGSGKAITLQGAYLDNTASNRNLIIVICLAAISGMLAVVLVVAIVCMKKTEREHQLYNVQTAAVKAYEPGPNQEVDELNNTKHKTPSRENYPTEVDDSTTINGHGLYASLRPPVTWKSSVYPKAHEV